MGAKYCIKLLYGLLLLTHSNGEHMVDTLIRQVGEMDMYLSTDLHRYLRGEDINTDPPDMIFGDWRVSLTFDIGPGYRGPAVTDERATLQGIFQSLNESTLAAKARHSNGRTCNVTIEGPQLLRNYVRYYRQLKEKMSRDSGLMTLGFEYEGVNVTLGIMRTNHVHEEGKIKYLPYAIHDLQDVFGFTVPSNRGASLFFTKNEVTVAGDCLPAYEFLNQSFWRNDSIPQPEARNHMGHSCDSGLTMRIDENIPCFDLIKDLEEHINQFFMVPIALQTNLFHMYSEQGGFRATHRVCTVGSEDLVKRKYVVNQCCTMQKQHRLRYGQNKHWFCYNPYDFSNILITMSKYLSVILVVLFPLTIKWLPEKHIKGNDRTNLKLSDVVKQNTMSVINGADSTHLKSKTETDVTTEWMFLDDDSGYHFSFKVILWHLLLCGQVNRGSVMLRRFLFLYMIALLSYLTALRIHLYYTDLYQNTWQFYFTTFAYQLQNVKWYMSKKKDFDMIMTLCLFVYPFAMAAVQFMLLSPVLFRKNSIAKILYWNEKDTAIGKYVGLKYQNQHRDVRHQPDEIKLFLNLSARVSYLTCFKFWKYVFTQSIFDTHSNDNTTCSLLIRLVIRVLLIPVTVPFYTFPIFSVFWVFFCGEGGFTFGKRKRCYVFLMRLVLGLGVLYSTSVLLACITMYVHMAMFVMIDVLRTLTNTFTHVIFLMSAIVNIKETFSSIENKYMELKLMLFNMLEDMSRSSDEEDQMVSKNMLKRFDKSTVAIPRSLFMKVSQEHMTYGRLVTSALLVLLLKLSFLGLLYMIIVDYQVFAQLSQTGEGFITIVFVSLPSLLSKTKSDAEKGLEDKHMYLKVKTTIIDVCLGTGETFPADPVKVDSKV